MNEPLQLSVTVSEFVALVNEAFDYAFPGVVITGELANLRVSKGKWLYFDLKDHASTVKFFGTVYMLPGPLEDGMLLQVRGTPRLHHQYGFSVNVESIRPTGEGSIRRAAQLLEAQLTAEGLFDEERKRPLPHPPRSIGLITSRQSAAYADFTKILNARWQGIDIQLIDVQVQGEVAPAQIVAAIEQFNEEALPPEVLVLIRGGGSAEDLAAFSTEAVTRAVAASRVPTLVAIGHEIDLSLAELAADQRASTPSNAAELLVPDRLHEAALLQSRLRELHRMGEAVIHDSMTAVKDYSAVLQERMGYLLEHHRDHMRRRGQLLEALNPAAIVRRGYAIVRLDGFALRSGELLAPGKEIEIQMRDVTLGATVDTIESIKESDDGQNESSR